MCYTSGTTGNPKGVVYSHRSTWIHSLAQLAAGSIGLTDNDSMLLIVPMFHANGWGTPYSGFMAGTSFVMPQQYLQGVHLARIIEEHRPTLACGVPTIWNDVLRVANEKPDVDLIKTEKTIVDKSCKMVNGKLKCAKKKKIIKKTI